MCKIIGQKNLLSVINNYTAENLPKTIMLIGPDGCGKHTVTKYLADRLDFDFLEIDTKVDQEALLDFSNKTINTLYLIDLNMFDEKQQNYFLKFIEEPAKSVFIVLIADSEAGILDTIKNRCRKFYFEEYTKEELLEITHCSGLSDSVIYEIFKTPGKLNLLTNESFSQLYSLANKLVDKIEQASYGNTLSVATMLNYKDNYDKVDPVLFLEVIEYIAFNKFKHGNNACFSIFSITNKFKQYFYKKTLIKEMLILNYLTKLWEATRHI